MTSVGAFWQCLRAGAACLRSWRSTAEALGVSDRFFVFVCDEPNEDPALWRTCDRRSDEAAAAWPGGAQLITATAHAAALFGPVALANADILAPIVNDLDDKSGIYARQPAPHLSVVPEQALRARSGAAAAVDLRLVRQRRLRRRPGERLLRGLAEPGDRRARL